MAPRSASPSVDYLANLDRNLGQGGRELNGGLEDLIEIMGRVEKFGAQRVLSTSRVTL